MNGDLLYSLTDSIGTLTLHRPEFRNAITHEMWLEIPNLLNKFKQDGAKVVVITGHGDCFGSGADLNHMEELKSLESARDLWHAIRRTLEFVWEFELPTIAMIPGPCIGGACLLAAACDLRYASFNATFSIPIARYGIFLDDRTISHLVALIGTSFAKELLFTGNTLSGQQAERIGLITTAIGQNELSIHVDEVARQIADNVDAAVRYCKASINRTVAGKTLDPDLNDEEVVQTYMSPEFKKRLGWRK